MRFKLLSCGLKLLKGLGGINGIKGIKGMVNNIFKILDENELKQLSKFDYNMGKLNLYNEVLKKSTRLTNVKEFDDAKCDFVTHQIHNENYKEPPPRIKYALKKYMDYNMEWDWTNHPKGPQNLETRFVTWCGGEETIYNYLEIIPFTPSVMINISPDWSNIKRSNTNKVTILKTIIDNYMKEEWFDKWEYVIENGSDGTHIHAHIVAHMNVKRLKSTESHLRKGNHTQQLKKYAKKLKGMEGIIKGSSVQKVFLRTEEILKDKLLYLHEDTKPEGHKNQSVIKDGYVSGCL